MTLGVVPSAQRVASLLIVQKELIGEPNIEPRGTPKRCHPHKL